jgi:beta-phosphoglucomutase-like phosphatase (HAD superfamily)
MSAQSVETVLQLGLPEQIRACLFDLDGALTETADVHRAVWAEVFEALLAAETARVHRPAPASQVRRQAGGILRR